MSRVSVATGEETPRATTEVDTMAIGHRTDRPAPSPSNARRGHDRTPMDREPADVGRADVHGVRLLISDTRTAFLLLDEARYRAVERLFGVPRDQSWMVTLIGLGVLTKVAHHRYEQIMKGPGGPARGDALWGAGAVSEVAHYVGGPSSRDVPFFTGLVVLAVAGHMGRPAVTRSLRGISASSLQMKRAFNHRYGHLVRVGG